MTDSKQQARELKAALRQAVADYMRSEGCSCCRNQDAHDEAEERIAKILNVPKYADGSGYDFGKFETKKSSPYNP